MGKLNGWTKRHTYRLQIAAHERWRFIPHPDHRQALKIDAQFGNDDFRDVHLSDEADIELQCLWAVEVFTPSHIPRLRQALKRLKLDNDELSHRGAHSKWISTQRESANMGGWSNLGYIARPDSKRMFPRYVIGPLPPSSQFASLHLHFISPSITVLTACFFWDAALSKAQLAAIKNDYEPTFRSYGRAYSVFPPSELKREAIVNIRRKMRRETAGWIRRYLPGIFSAGNDDKFPMIELMLTDRVNFDLNVSDMLDVPEFYRNKSVNWPGVSFSWPRSRDLEEAVHGVLLADREPLAQHDTSMYGNGRDKYPFVFEHGMTAFAAMWGLLAAIRTLRARLSRLRDSNFGYGRKDAAKIIDLLRTMTLESVDTSSISYDLRNFSSRAKHAARSVADFEVPDFRGGPSGKRLSTWLFKTIESEAAELERLDESVKTRAMQQGTLLATAQNLQLQRWVGRITVVAAILAAVSAYQPITQLAALISCTAKGGHLTTGAQPACATPKR